MFASQSLPFSRRLSWSIPEPSRSALPLSRDRPCGALQRRPCGHGLRRCASLQHSPGCFGAFCPPYSGKRSCPGIWSLPPCNRRRWSIEYIADGSLFCLHIGGAAGRKAEFHGKDRAQVAEWNPVHGLSAPVLFSPRVPPPGHQDSAPAFCRCRLWPAARAADRPKVSAVFRARSYSCSCHPSHRRRHYAH
jgi:hypothetical protein